MKVVFIGSSKFGLRCLKAIHNQVNSMFSHAKWDERPRSFCPSSSMTTGYLRGLWVVSYGAEILGIPVPAYIIYASLLPAHSGGTPLFGS